MGGLDGQEVVFDCLHQQEYARHHVEYGRLVGVTHKNEGGMDTQRGGSMLWLCVLGFFCWGNAAHEVSTPGTEAVLATERIKSAKAASERLTSPLACSRIPSTAA